MDFKTLLSEAKPEDIDKLEKVLPLLKERARMERLIATRLSAGSSMVKTGKKPASPKVQKKRKAGQSAPAKKVSSATPAVPAKKPTPKAPAKRPVRNSKVPTLTEAACACLKGKKDASVAELIEAVAKLRKMKLTKASRNVIKVSLYTNKSIKRVAPGRFALA